MSEQPQTQTSEQEDEPVRERHLALEQDVREAVWDEDARWLSRTLNRLHPADAADLLEQLSTEDFSEAVKLLGGQLPTEIIIELRDEYREEAVFVLPDEAVAAVLEELDSDDVTTILEDLDEDRRERILDELTPADRATFEQGLAYEEDSVGRLMQREYFAAPEFWTVGHAIDHARDNAEALPTEFYEVYVIDPTHRLKGQVPLGTLLRTPRDVKLADIMEEVQSGITAEMDQEDAAYQFQKYSLASAPVVDKAGRLTGMLTVDDVVDVIQEENTEDLLALSGVNSAEGTDTVLDSVKARAPWLAVNLFTAFIASGIISLFEGTIDQIVQLAILMPVVAALGGNAGSQGLAVAVRAIAEREMDGDASRRAIVRETLTGIANGVLFAIGVALIAGFWFQSAALALTIGVAMFATFVWAGFSGVIVPLSLRKVGADPAVASSVFVLTLTDIMAFFSFLGLATLILL
ncbi:magnesium transporter [Henriciella aquimarina]|uniref:magnesium transporter n=1 Tax=Henriciella aquimarina TaxID=545261 RepID=UPI000A01FC4E|nr:magnesium transporter [Henriciella aquimarina]